MTLKEDFLNLGKGKLTQAKAFLEDLEVQMHLGKAEARDAFHREKKTLSTFLNKQKAQLKVIENMADDKKAALLKSVVTLEDQLGMEIPTAKRKFDQQKKETLEKIYKLEYQLKEAHDDVSLSLQSQLDDFKIKLDTYRIQLALGKFENEELLAKRKNELQKNVDEIRLKLQKETVKGDRIDHFTGEIAESFDHMKKAFADLFE